MYMYNRHKIARFANVLLLLYYYYDLCADAEMSILFVFFSPLHYVRLVPPLIPPVYAVSTRQFRFTCCPWYTIVRHNNTLYTIPTNWLVHACSIRHLLSYYYYYYYGPDIDVLKTHKNALKNMCLSHDK